MASPSVVVGVVDEWHAYCLFERFTPAARRAISEAQEQARALGNRHVDDEHLLLGLLHELGSGAAEVLRSRGVSEEAVRARLLTLVSDEDKQQPSGPQVALTPRAKRVLELALREALAFGTNAVGTEHLLLGIAREPESIAMRIVREGWDLYPEAVRGAVIEALYPRLIPPNRGAPVPRVGGI